MWIQTTNNVITVDLSFESDLFSIVDNIGFDTRIYLAGGWKSEKIYKLFHFFVFSIMCV